LVISGNFSTGPHQKQNVFLFFTGSPHKARCVYFPRFCISYNSNLPPDAIAFVMDCIAQIRSKA
jgi:hypothetical protein